MTSKNANLARMTMLLPASAVEEIQQLIAERLGAGAFARLQHVSSENAMALLAKAIELCGEEHHPEAYANAA